MILSVLKVIGIVLLVILVLCFLILGIVLFVPIRYEFAAEYDNDMKANGLVRWNPILLKVVVNYEDGELEYIIRLLGGVVKTNLDIPLSWIGRRFFSKEDDEKQTGSKVVKDDKNEKKSTDLTLDTKTPEESIQLIDNTDEMISESNMKRQSEKSQDEKLLKQQTVDKKHSFFDKICGKLKERIDDIQNYVRIIISKLKQLNAKREALLKVYHSKRFDVAKKDAIQYIKEAFRIIKPRKAEGYIHFGLEDPSGTGQIVGMIAMFIPWYDAFLQIQPDFEKACLDGKINGKGRIYLFSVAKLVLKIMFNKNLIKVIKKVQTIIEA